ncbi:hypothetical protein CkaCkLH20_12444 [Colletotrichum karsti]|uniref:Uncharacterized protein n=1 Tax=Colletotrichum karsti TaxID=1095194 RepID=A0A9P6I1C9_9PEZI|nr:uncharacterized protein CkaCkLH20_12444 [Colletotrichum karsti]KAF9870085.1 hypothetical protein CkaCkLH20_12444 [Colletotrichum karsti]
MDLHQPPDDSNGGLSFALEWGRYGLSLHYKFWPKSENEVPAGDSTINCLMVLIRHFNAQLASTDVLRQEKEKNPLIRASMKLRPLTRPKIRVRQPDDENDVDRVRLGTCTLPRQIIAATSPALKHRMANHQNHNAMPPKNAQSIPSNGSGQKRKAPQGVGDRKKTRMNNPGLCTR